MKILITGSTGMLGVALCDELSEQYEVIPFERKDCDITQKAQLIDKISYIRPEIIIHSAAFTDVDGCELEPDKAYDVNAKGAETVAIASQRVNALLIYISTDYVFDGKKNVPYLETDQPNPLSVYGKSKLEGEGFVQSISKKCLIIRSSWLFGRGRKNFVDHIIERAKKEKVLQIANDKFSSPTYALDLAGAIKVLLSTSSFACPVSPALAGSFGELSADSYGIYHITNSGCCSWYEYAQKILECAAVKEVKLLPISLSEINLKAPRPKYSVLDNSRYNKLTQRALRPWPEALAEYVRK